MTDVPTWALLSRICSETKCFPGWTFNLTADNPPELHITISGHNNYKPDEPFVVTHCHPVPHASYNEASWRRWIFEQCRRTMNHEIGEALRFGTDENPIRPFVPMHGPGEDPYTVHEWRSEEDARKDQRGRRREGPV